MIAAQCRAGRGPVNMTVKELAAAGQGRDRHGRAIGERHGAKTVHGLRNTDALESAGVEFLPAGVRLKCGPRCGWAGR